jgi:hypothetical protein
MGRKLIKVQRPTAHASVNHDQTPIQSAVNRPVPCIDTLECRLLMSTTPQVPTIVLSSSPLQYIEKQGAAPLDPALAIQDANGETIVGANIRLLGYLPGEDTLSAPSENGISPWWDPSSGVLYLTGQASVANYQAELQSVSYMNASYNPTTSPRTAQFTVNHAQFGISSASRGILITAVNDPPGVQTPPVQTTASGSQLILSNVGGNAIIISDVDANGAIEQVTLSPIGGSLRLPSATGVSTTDGPTTITLDGTVAAINAALDGLTFTPTSPYAETASIEVTANDLGNSGIGGAQIVNVLIPIRISGLTAPPPIVGTGRPPPVVGEPAPPPVPAPPPAGGKVVDPPPTVGAAIPNALIRETFTAAAEAGAVQADSFKSSQFIPALVRVGSVFDVDENEYRTEIPDITPTIELQNTQIEHKAFRRAAGFQPLATGASFSTVVPTRFWPRWGRGYESARAVSDWGVGVGFISRSVVRARVRGNSTAEARGALSSPAPSVGLADSTMLRELNSARRSVGSEIRLRVWAGAASLVSAGASLAYFLWAARGGSLLSGLLSSVPPWTLIDPLPILDGLAKSAAMLKNDGDGGLQELIADAAGK